MYPSLEFSPEKKLNGHNSLIKQHVAMNLPPLDSSRQDVSFELKKIHPGLVIFEKIAKN
jgi:hypothetical protein